MAKSAFNFVAIRPGMELKYREFWIENKNTSSDGTELHSAMLADTGIVEARSKTEAEALAKRKFPGRKIEVSRIG